MGPIKVDILSNQSSSFVIFKIPHIYELYIIKLTYNNKNPFFNKLIEKEKSNKEKVPVNFTRKRESYYHHVII